MEEATSRVESIAGPPCLMAEMQDAIKLPEVPIIRMYPGRNLPTPNHLRIVVTPLMASAPLRHDGKITIPSNNGDGIFTGPKA